MLQYLLIARYNTSAPPPDPEFIRATGQHWGEFLGNLQRHGRLISGLRPEQTGRMITGKDLTVQETPCIADKYIVSSVMVIKAASLDEATAIAKRCPIIELGGTVEIRPVMNTAN
jgi:hypothetical protein